MHRLDPDQDSLPRLELPTDQGRIAPQPLRAGQLASRVARDRAQRRIARAVLRPDDAPMDRGRHGRGCRKAVLVRGPLWARAIGIARAARAERLPAREAMRRADQRAGRSSSAPTPRVPDQRPDPVRPRLPRQQRALGQQRSRLRTRRRRSQAKERTWSRGSCILSPRPHPVASRRRIGP